PIPQPPGSNWLGIPHRFRIEWNASSVVFFIDGNQVASHAITVSTPLRPLASDFNLSGAVLSLAWLRTCPYEPTPSIFDSRIFDAQGTVNWSSATWTSNIPAGTSLVVSVRTGDTPVPDGSWTPFNVLSGPGAAIGSESRYLQYPAEMSTSDPARTPEVE